MRLFRARSSIISPRPKHKKSSGVNLASMEAADTQPLVGGQDLPTSPRLWLLLGILYCCLGLTQIVLAALWRWWFGVAVGLGILKTGSSLTGLGWAGGRQVRPEATTLLGKLKRLLMRMLLWGTSKVHQLLWRLRWLIYANGVFVALLIAIHLSSPDPRPLPAAFPAACPREKRFGCSRVAEDVPHFARGLRPVYLPASVEAAQAAAEAWVAAQAGMGGPARVLSSTPGFLHARFVTWFWGFADDFFVSVRCHNATHAVVEVQGQLRIGQSDLGVNKRRNRRFLDAMAEEAELGTIPRGRCLKDDPQQGEGGGAAAAGQAAMAQQAARQAAVGQQQAAGQAAVAKQQGQAAAAGAQQQARGQQQGQAPAAKGAR